MQEIKSVVSLEPNEISETKEALYSLLGSFWKVIYEDPAFIRDIQTARSYRASQLYLDLLETLVFNDRNKFPVFHRDLWHPIILRRSSAGKGSATTLVVSKTDPVYSGDTTHDPIVGPGNISDRYISYKIIGDSITSCTCIVDNIMRPEVIMKNGTDFLLGSDSIAILKDYDPFSEMNSFAKVRVSTDGVDDIETVLWACDSLLDENSVYEHLGILFGLQEKSSEQYKNIINSLWDAVSQGSTEFNIRRMIAYMCGFPIVENEKEIVEKIFSREDGGTTVVTDKSVYELCRYTEPSDKVKLGNELSRGTFIDSAVQLFINVPSYLDNPAYSEDIVEKMRDAIQTVQLQPSMIRTGVEDGFSVGWEEKTIVSAGLDKNGNPKLWFSLDGSDEDNLLFWNDVWKSYEDSNESMESCFEGCFSNDILELEEDLRWEAGNEVGTISPMLFFIRNLLGPNTIFISVDASKLDDSAKLYDPKFFGALAKCIPSHKRLIIIEHNDFSSDDEYDLESDSEMEEDQTDCFAYDDLEEEYGYGGVVGMQDSLSKKVIPRCRTKENDFDKY